MKCNACTTCCDIKKMKCNGELIETNDMCIATHNDAQSVCKSMTNMEVVEKMGLEVFVSLAVYTGALESTHNIVFKDEDELFESVMNAARYFISFGDRNGFDTWKVFDEGLFACRVS
jgi:hypothetical protein